ncbi:MAG: sensor histidine kinase [Planctomycetota bacterium]|jgi:signal transduction histidine kinase
MPGDHARVLEGLVRLLKKVGSHTDAREAVCGIVRDVVGDLGLAGATLWHHQHDGFVPLCTHGAAIPEDLVQAARKEMREEEDCIAWPLLTGRKALGVFAVRGSLTGPLRAVTSTLAGRCAHILDDAQRTSAQRAVLEGLSHELRAPLQALLGYIDLLRGGSLGALAEAQAEALASVSHNAERVLSVTRDVLQVARIDAGHEKVIVGEVDLEELIRREVDAVRPLADAAGLALGQECPPGLRVVSDGPKVARILTNLLTNAVKYTPRGGVTVRAGRGTGGVFLEVEDTGVGIPRDKQAEVFDEYVRLDGSREGTGLGLAIARRLADLIGGRVTLGSEVGRGTTVRLDLPA